MDASFVPNKRTLDHSSTTIDRGEPHFTNSKRRHHHHPSSSSAPPQSTPFRQPPPPIKLASSEALFRILCPAPKTGGLIGKGGSIIRQVREDTGAKIRIDDSIPGCEERVILIIADSTITKKDSHNYNSRNNNDDNGDTNSGDELGNAAEESPAQKALLKVFERILKVDEERSKLDTEGEKLKVEEKREEGGGEGQQRGQVVCRLLAPCSQVGSVLGRGGKIIERIRQSSGAQVRVLPKVLIPECASPGDELIQMTGNYSAVRKALLSVSSCLQDNQRADAANSGTTKSSGMALHVSGTESIGSNHRMVFEEEVVFKLLCQVDKVGSLIGKGGSVIRALQSETGASIKIADAAPDSDERVVIISARENSDQRHSPAQDAVIRVHGRIAEIGFEPGAAVVARLLVHSQQVGCLWGKGGMIIAELRRVTGASIHIFPKEQVPKYGIQNDEVVQVIGRMQAVQDALFQITGRLRETIFPIKPHVSSVSGSPYLSPYPEMPPPSFRPRHDPASSPVGLPRNADRVAVPGPPFEPPLSFSHGMDRHRPTYQDRVTYPYGNERLGHGPSFNRQSSPGRWTSQAAGSENSGGVPDVERGFALINDPVGSGNQDSIVGSSVEVVIPQTLLGYVYGENNSNLVQIRQISGAKVVVSDPRPGATEGLVVVSGKPDQIHLAQSLIHAFILAEQNS